MTNISIMILCADILVLKRQMTCSHCSKLLSPVWSVACIAGPLPSGTLLKVEPHWGYWKPHLQQMPSCIAGYDMNGHPLYILSVIAYVEVDFVQYKQYKQNSMLGVGSRETPSQYGTTPFPDFTRSHECVLRNVDQLQFIKVTLQTVQTVARLRGVRLSTKHYRLLYACRIDFFGWKDGLVNKRQDNAEFKRYVRGAPAALLPGSYELGSLCPIFCFDDRWNNTFDQHASFELLCYRYAWYACWGKSGRQVCLIY